MVDCRVGAVTSISMAATVSGKVQMVTPHVSACKLTCPERSEIWRGSLCQVKIAFHSKHIFHCLLAPLEDGTLYNDSSQLISSSMSQVLLETPREHCNTYRYPGHEGSKALQSCGIQCAVWGEDLLWHLGVPTAVFDHFLLVANPEKAASKLKSLGFRPLPLNPRYRFLQELTRNSIRLQAPGQRIDEHMDQPTVVLLPADAWHFSMRLLHPKSDIIPPLYAIIESYIDTSLDAETLDFRCHLGTHMGYIAEYVKDAKDPGLPGMLRYKYQQDYWRTYLKSPIFDNERAFWRARRQAELFPADP
jgi:hypothetical protein